MDNRIRELTKFAGLLTFCLAVVYFMVLFAGRDFFYKDTSEFFEPLCRFIAGSLARGHLPVWNPYAYCGMSQAAIISPSIFFPLNWLFGTSLSGASRFSSSLSTVLIICHLITAIGTYLLIDSFNWGTRPAAIGAIAVALCGYMFSLTSNYTLVATAAFVPLSIYSSKRCLSGSTRWFLVNVLVTFLLITAGRPEIWIAGMVLSLAVCLLGCVPPGEATGLRTRMFSVLISMFLGVLLAMPAILPALEWIPRSERGSLAPSEVLMFSANWYDMMNIFVPEPFGNLQSAEHSLANLVSPASSVPYGGSPFVGSIILALALMGIFKRGGRAYWAAMILLLSSAVFALGENVPGMSALISHTPGLTLLRFPRKLLFFTDFALALFAARGAYLYARNGVPLAWHMLAWAIITAAGSAIAFSSSVVLPFYPPANFQQAVDAQHTIGMAWLSQAFIGLLAVSVMWLLQSKRKSEFALTLVLVSAGTMLLSNAVTNCLLTCPSGFYDHPSYLVDNIGFGQHTKERKPRIAAVYPPTFIVPDVIYERIDRHNPAEVAAQIFEYNRDLMRGFSNIDFEIPSPLGFEGAKPAAYDKFYTLVYSRSAQARTGVNNPSDVPLYRWLQITSCKYICTQMYDHFVDGKMESAARLDDRYFDLVFSNAPDNIRAYLIKDALPRAYLAGSWRAFSSPSELLSHMINAETTGFDPVKETLVDKNIGSPPPVARLVPVEINEPEPEQLSMHVKTGSQRLLVLQDQFYPGWHVTIDGRPAELLRCNAFMRGVIVPPGDHQISFYFRPFSLTLGFALATIAAIAALAIAFAPRLLRKQQADATIESRL